MEAPPPKPSSPATSLRGSDSEKKESSDLRRKRRSPPPKIDLAAEEDAEEAERMRREKSHRLHLEAAVSLAPLDHGDKIELQPGYRLTSRLAHDLAFSIDPSTDETWLFYDAGSNTNTKGGPSSGIMRFDADWNALELPKSLRRGIYLGEERGEMNLRDDSESPVTIYVKEARLLVPCSDKKMLYVVGDVVDVYTAATKTTVRHESAVVCVSMTRDSKTVVAIPTTATIKEACATSDGTLHLFAYASATRELFMLSFELLPDGISLAPKPWGFLITRVSEAHLKSDRYNRGHWVDGDSELVDKNITDIWQATARNQDIHITVGTSKDRSAYKSSNHDCVGLRYLTGKGQVESLFWKMNQLSGARIEKDFSPIDKLEEPERKESLLTDGYAKIYAQMSMQGHWQVYWPRQGMYIAKRAGDQASYEVREERYRTSDVKLSALAASTRIVVDVDRLIFGARGTRVLFSSDNNLYEMLHTRTYQSLREKYDRFLLEHSDVPLMARQISWRMAGILASRADILAELSFVASRVLDNFHDYVFNRDIITGGVLYAAFTNKPADTIKNSRICGLMMLFAHPEARNGIFFAGPSGLHAPSIFHPYDGLEVEFLATIRSEGSAGSGELLIALAKMLAYRLGYKRLNLKALHQAVVFYIKQGMHTRYGDEHDLFLSTLDADQNPRNVSEVMTKAQFQEYGRWIASVITRKMPGRTTASAKADECYRCYLEVDSGLVAMSIAVNVETQRLAYVLDPSPKRSVFPPEFYSPLTKNPFEKGSPYVPDVVNLANQLQESVVVSVGQGIDLY